MYKDSFKRQMGKNRQIEWKKKIKIEQVKHKNK